MKKIMMAFCCAALAVAAFAEPKAGAQGKGAANAPRNRPGGGMQLPNGPNGGGFPMPTMLKIDGTTTAQQIKDFKKQINDKIDAAFKAQSADKAADKQPTTIIFFVNEGNVGFGGMGGMGMPQGFGGQGMQGMPRGMGQNRPAAPAH